MAMQQVKKERIAKAKEQIAEISAKLIEHARTAGPVFEYSHKGRLYSGVKDFFESEGWHVEEKSFDDDSRPVEYTNVFTISEESDMTAADLMQTE